MLGTDRHGQEDKAYHFDGNDFIDAGNGESLRLVDAITITAWIAPSSSPAVAWIIGKNRDISGGFHLNQYGSIVSAHVQGLQGGSVVNFPFSINDGWMFTSYTYHKEFGGALYQNGLVRGTSESTGEILANSSVTNLNIGRHAHGNLYYFHGLIDDIRIYNRVLSANEIGELVRTGSSPK